MVNSELITNEIISPNHSGQRTERISRITPHVAVGQLSADRIASLFISPEREASCNYAIGADCNIDLVVPESYISWCSHSHENDSKAVTIECACELEHPYEVNEDVFETLISLCTDICYRNGISRLIWIDDKEEALSYELDDTEAIITVHRWFEAKTCPGDYLYSRLGELAASVTARLSLTNKFEDIQNLEQGNSMSCLYKVQAGAFEYETNAGNRMNVLKDLGYDVYDNFYGGLHHIQVGAFREKENAEKMVEKLRNDGFEAFIISVYQ